MLHDSKLRSLPIWSLHATPVRYYDLPSAVVQTKEATLVGALFLQILLQGK